MTTEAEFEAAAKAAGWIGKFGQTEKWWNPGNDDGSRYCVNPRACRYICEDHGLSPVAGFIVVMQPPTGAPEYMPEGFGFTAHAHTLDRAKAARWPTAERARQAGDGYRWPSAFWNSERAHRDKMAERFRRWSFTVEPA